VVHGIVGERNGGITVESEKGEGTTFRVYLPASEKEHAEGLPEEKPALPKGSERVLLVDDEPMILKLGKRMLERQGYEVEPLASGTDALECFKHDPARFDLVVTDMTMPGMRGDKLAEEIMKIRDDIPVILATGYSKQISEEKAKEIGIRAFVMKPLTQQELASTVRRVLDES
jgi:CheY-like chemotaxis protein